VSAPLIAAIAFLIVCLALIVASVGALLFMGLERLSGSEAIQRDGLRRGTRAPRWRQDDLDGLRWQVPDGRHKFLLFADHSLREFTEAADELSRLAASDTSVDVIVLTRGEPTPARHVLVALGCSFPVVQAGPQLYRRYRVRVMPYCTVVDGEGRVRYAGLAASAPTVLTAWREGTLRPLPSDARHPAMALPDLP
jgi:hypothetical protein